MGVVIAYRTVDLTHDADVGHLVALALQAMNHVGHLLAQCGGGGRLAMGTGQHGFVGMFMGQLLDRLDQFFHLGDQYLSAAFTQHQGVGEVVDIFRGAGEVDEFADRFQLFVACNLLF